MPRRATLAPPALLAQLVEHFHGKEGVAGSSPAEGFRGRSVARPPARDPPGRHLGEAGAAVASGGAALSSRSTVSPEGRNSERFATHIAQAGLSLRGRSGISACPRPSCFGALVPSAVRASDWSALVTAAALLHGGSAAQAARVAQSSIYPALRDSPAPGGVSLRPASGGFRSCLKAAVVPAYGSRVEGKVLAELQALHTYARAVARSLEQNPGQASIVDSRLSPLPQTS